MFPTHSASFRAPAQPQSQASCDQSTVAGPGVRKGPRQDAAPGGSPGSGAGLCHCRYHSPAGTSVPNPGPTASAAGQPPNTSSSPFPVPSAQEAVPLRQHRMKALCDVTCDVTLWGRSHHPVMSLMMSRVLLLRDVTPWSCCDVAQDVPPWRQG